MACAAPGRASCRTRRRHGPLRGGGGDQHLPPGGADLAHRQPVHRRCRAAAGDLGRVARVEVGLLDLHVRPVGIEFLGDQHGQHHLHALADLGVLRGDGDLAVRRDAEIGVQRHRVGARRAERGRPGAAGRGGMAAVSSMPPPAARLTLRKFLRASISDPPRCGGALDGRTDARVGGAATDIAAHRHVDVVVGGNGDAGEQRGRGHDLARLAVAALRHVQLDPGGLDVVADLAVADRLDRGDRGASPTEAMGVWQARAGRPSRCTVQAPHCAAPQPNLVPLRSSVSRSTQSSGVSPSTSTLRLAPLTSSVYCMVEELRQPASGGPDPERYFGAQSSSLTTVLPREVPSRA